VNRLQLNQNLEVLTVNTTTIVIIAYFAAAVVLAITAAIWLNAKARRTKLLRSKFGPEYNRMARARGDAAEAEQVLKARQKRVAKLEIRPLNASQRAEFADRWELAQARFVDDPTAAVAIADILVQEVMNQRGYPVVDFEQRVADVSVDHPSVVQNYRLAHDIGVRDEKEDVGLEKLRAAMLHYRALFADLLHDGGLQPVRQVRPEPIRRAA
jgi:hypothetical protein